jgi:hypothetical protein
MPKGNLKLIHIAGAGIGRQYACDHIPVRHHAGALVRAIHQCLGEGREFPIVFNCHAGLRMHPIEVPPFPVRSRVIADELQLPGQTVQTQRLSRNRSEGA